MTSASDMLISYIESVPELLECVKSIFYPYEMLLIDCLTLVNNHKPILGYDALLTKIKVVLNYLYEELYAGCWSDIPISIRRVFSIASFMKTVILLQEKEGSKEDLLRQALECLDKGLLLGAPLVENSELLHKSASYLMDQLNEMRTVQTPINVTNIITVRQHCDPELYTKYKNIIAKEISTATCPSVEQFNTQFFVPETPVILKECISYWPAMEKWLNINYLLTTAGNRTVPIEIGTHYVDENWGQKLMTLQDFITNHFLCDTPSENLGYLAQHNLFDQIPELRNDISVPDYCCLSKSDEESCEADINAWFGPKNTVSPLHYDPKNNLLAQVFGTKQILLFAPDDSEYLYPHEENMLKNTAQVNPLISESEKFPSFSKATMFKCLLRPGDVLYIPPKWWHHVTALDKSFSVSFWWE